MRPLPHPKLPALKLAVPFLAYAGLAAAFFWPLVRQPGSGLHDRSDSALNTWIINWQAHILVRNPAALFNAPIFYPLRNSLALSEIIWPGAPLAVPLLAASGNPLLVYNGLYLAGFVLAGLGAYLLALHLTHSRPAALLAGVIYAFSPHQFGHLSQIQLLSIGWLPLIVLFLDRFWTKGRALDGLLFALAAAAQALSAFYYAFQVVLVVGLYVLCRLVSVPPRRSLPVLARTVGWSLLAGLLVLPFTLPYFQVRAELGLERSLAGTLAYAPPLTDYLLPRPDHPLYGRFMPKLAGGGLFLGAVPVTLGAIGLYAGLARRRRSSHPKAQGIGLLFWGLLFLSAAVLSLGPQLKLTAGDPGGVYLPFRWLYLHVPGMTAIRAPGRFGVSVFLALAVLAAWGARRLLGRLNEATGRLLVVPVWPPCACMNTQAAWHPLRSSPCRTCLRRRRFTPGSPHSRRL